MEKRIIYNSKEFIQFRDTIYYIDSDGEVFSNHSKKILKYYIRNINNYKSCIISLYIDKKKYKFLLHRIIMECFYGKSYLQVNHKDGNSLNNNLNNLEYVTPHENTIHYYKNKNINYGAHKHRNKYQARIKLNGKQIIIGRYETQEEAHNAYIEYCKEKQLKNKYIGIDY